MDSTASAIVTVSALTPGHFFLPHSEVFQDAYENNAKTGDIVPTFAFLIQHPSHGKYLFDLGLRKHGQGYPPTLDDTLAEFKPECDEDVSDILRKHNIRPADINGVIYSHLHFDHVGDILPFTSAEIVLGAEAKGRFESTYPDNPRSTLYDWPKDRSVRYIDFPSVPQAESPLKSFENVYDFFSDGSLLLVDAPGHFPGHLAALARVSVENAEAVYVLLPADSCHNRVLHARNTSHQ